MPRIPTKLFTVELPYLTNRTTIQLTGILFNRKCATVSLLDWYGTCTVSTYGIGSIATDRICTVDGTYANGTVYARSVRVVGVYDEMMSIGEIGCLRRCMYKEMTN